MALSPTAQRMLDSLPDYYWQNDIIERIVQGKANEVDRMDARIDSIIAGVVPGTADDSLGFLRIWETMLKIPVAPAGASEAQRAGAITAALRRLNAVTSSDVLDLLTAAIGPSFTIARNTPTALQDTITIPYVAGSFQYAQVVAVAATLWPAHRELLVHSAGGFILDHSVLDTDTL